MKARENGCIQAIMNKYFQAVTVVNDNPVCEDPAGVSLSKVKLDDLTQVVPAKRKKNLE